MITASKFILAPLAALLLGSTAGHAADGLTLPAKAGTATGSPSFGPQTRINRPASASP